MRCARVAAVCLASFVLLAGVAAVAGPARGAGPADLGLRYETAVRGAAPVALVLQPTVAIRKLRITLTTAAPAPDGAEQVLASGPIAAGHARRLTFRHRAGRATYRGAIDVTWASGEVASYDFTFEAARYEPLSLAMTWQDVDLAQRELTCRPSHAIATLEVTVLGDGGTLGVATRTFDPPAGADEALTIDWRDVLAGAADAAPKALVVKATDADGVWASTRIEPFTIAIPHDEVQFALGSATIAPTEEPKLVKTLDELRAALRAHGTLLDLKLFIAGFTDTVGDRASNAALSVARAASIARWFRAHGIRLAIFYRGLGEDGLAVPTPDETDEPRNRRALYILSVHPPLGVRVAEAGWSPLH